MYIGLSFSGFWNYDDTIWYNLTDTIYSLVGEGNSSNGASVNSISFILTLEQYLLNVFALLRSSHFPYF